MKLLHHPRSWAAAAVVLAACLFVGAASAHAISGAIFTTTVDGNTVNGNIYDLKSQVYLNGGPSNEPGCNGGELQNGDYYFQVTDPSGAVLLSTDVAAERKFRVSGGEISTYLGSSHGVGGPSACGSLAIQLIPYNDTPNNGGVYKVWITHASDLEALCDPATQLCHNGFVPGHTKTDNFKVKCPVGDPICDDQQIEENGRLQAYKFYDANANGLFDAGDLDLPGWKMTLTSVNQGVDSDHFTGADGTTLWDPLIPDSDYFVTEGIPIEGNWVHTTTIYLGHDGSPQNPAGPLTVNPNETTEVAFGNYCTVPPNGRTLGFWSNKNGQALIDAGDRAALVALNLRNKDGSNFDPANNAQIRTWLLNGDAVNMAYMLSVQLAAMKLSVLNGIVDGNGFYVPAGMTINQIMDAANASLGLHAVTLSGHPERANQQQLKNWLDALNNNAGVLSPTPCPFTFP